MNGTLKGLRIITNLSCNMVCKFCYQKDKSGKILSPHTLLKELVPYKANTFEYCTIMGGESTLLGYKLGEYIEIGSVMSNNNARLTTNGALLNKELMLYYKQCGLSGLNISIATLQQYNETTGSKLSIDELLEILKQAKEIFPNLRINIALCKENMDGEITQLLRYFIGVLGLNVTICEDIHETYSLIHTTKLMESELIEDTGNGLLFFKHLPSGKKFGYYHHADNYKNTDLIISPLGTFVAWDKFCEAIGYNNEN